MDLFESLKQKVSGKGMRIVFPEATDARILNAVVRLHSEGLVVPILIGNEAEVHKAAENYRFNLDGIEILDPKDYAEFDAMVDAFVERTKDTSVEVASLQTLSQRIKCR